MYKSGFDSQQKNMFHRFWGFCKNTYARVNETPIMRVINESVCETVCVLLDICYFGLWGIGYITLSMICGYSTLWLLCYSLRLGGLILANIIEDVDKHIEGCGLGGGGV